MTEIMVSDVNLNSVCERLEQHCCVDQNQHNLSSQPQTPVLKRHSNTGAKLWGRVRSKLLRQKVSRLTYAHTRAHVTHTRPVFPLFFLSFALFLFISLSLPSVCPVPLTVCVYVCAPFHRVSSFTHNADYCSQLTALLTAKEAAM